MEEVLDFKKKAGVIKMKEALWKASKEPLRLLVLAIIPVAVIYFTDLNWQYAGVAIIILRWIDKILHEIGKYEEAKNPNNLLIKGITRF